MFLGVVATIIHPEYFWSLRVVHIFRVVVVFVVEDFRWRFVVVVPGLLSLSEPQNVWIRREVL